MNSQQYSVQGAPDVASAQRRWFVLFVMAFFGVWVLRATVLYPIDEGITSPAWRRVYADTVRLAIWVLPVLAYARWVARRPAIPYLKLNRPVRSRARLHSALIVIVYLAGGQLIEYVTSGGPARFSLAPLAEQPLASALFLTVVPFSEEVLYRGFILQRMRAWLRFWPANALTSVLFVAIHWPYWLYSQGFQPALLVDSAKIFALSLLLGYLVKQTDSVWPSIGAHAANNLLPAVIRFG